MKTRHCPAFSLVELLVVTAMIGILAALLTSGLSRAKTSAHRVTCINNLSQWGKATHLYTEDNGDRLPRESATDGINTWEMAGASTNSDVWYNALPSVTRVVTMAHYAQTPSSQQDFYSRVNIFHCPRARFSDVAATYPNFSLAINSKLMGDFESVDPIANAVRFRLLRMSQIKVPDRTALFLDNGIPGEARLCEFQAPYRGEPKAAANQFPGRHSGAGNILFFDGHVATLPGHKVVQMDPSSPHRGAAIHPPAEVIWRHDPALAP